MALFVLGAFFTVVGAGTLFACPLMQAPSCCSKSNPGHCPAENPDNCLLAVSENKISTAKEKVAAAVPPAAAADPLPEMAPQADAGEPLLPARDGRETYLVNRILLI